MSDHETDLAKSTRVKICGTGSEADVRHCVEAGADALGFVVEYPDPVPWDLDREEAARLIRQVPPFVSTVLVTTGDVDTVLELTDSTNPDVVQLHGDEAPATVEALVPALAERGIETLKAVPIDPGESLDTHRETIAAFESCGVDGLVIDAKAEDRRGGGTGRPVPWSRARTLVSESSVPVVLAGGLTPDTVKAAIDAVRPYGVDVISSVERADRSKDPAAVAAFVAEAKGFER